MFAIHLTLVWVCIQFTAGQECRVTGDKTNSLKCGEQVYTRSTYYLDDLEKCNPGEIGTLYTQSWVKKSFLIFNSKEWSSRRLCSSWGRRPKDPPIVKCLMKIWGWENGRTFQEDDWIFQEDFWRHNHSDPQSHSEPFMQLLFSCWEAGKDDPPESTEIIQCLSKGYEKICGYKTCNWLNNFE